MKIETIGVLNKGIYLYDGLGMFCANVILLNENRKKFSVFSESRNQKCLFITNTGSELPWFSLQYDLTHPRTL